MKLLKYIGVAALVSLPLTGCSDFLEADNKSSANVDGDSYLSGDPAAFRPVMYDSFRFLGTEIALHEEATDLYLESGTGDGYGEYLLTVEDGGVKSYYQNAYNAINYANGLIHYAGEGTSLAYEGRFFRNLGYYYLIQQFGAVPYITTYIQTSTRDYPRTALSDLYPALIADLTDLYENSNLPASDNTGATVSKQAVAALLAKITLSAAWDLDTTLGDAEKGTYTVNSTTRFAEAAQWAEKAINGVQLTMPFADKWSPKNETNAEMIFAMQYSRAGYPGDVHSGGHSMQNQYMAMYGNCVQSGQKGTGSGGKHRQSYKSTRLFEKGDERWDGTFMTVFYNAPLDNSGNALWGKEGYMAYYNCTPEQLASKRIALKFYPSTTTTAEAQADLANIASQTKKPNASEKFGYKQPFAAIVNYPTTTVFEFKEDGTVGDPKSERYADWCVSQYHGVCVKKYDDPESENVTGSNCYRNIPIFHVSDMYLIAAEAYLLAGQDGQALTKINDVRRRAKVAPLSSLGSYTPQYDVPAGFNAGAIDQILDERARELYAEGTRYEDLRRTKQLVRYNVNFSRTITSVAQMSNGKGEIKWYRPIPAAEMNTNTALTPEDQNPGY